MTIHESAEDYLEAILMIQERKGTVRSVDIADQLGVSKPSVSIAMRKLRESGLVEMDEISRISLTEEGLRIAARIYDRHRTLSHLIETLGVPADVAAEDACRVEHYISDETFHCLRDHYTDLSGELTAK